MAAVAHECCVEAEIAGGGGRQLRRGMSTGGAPRPGGGS
jgi:hypothetical protein